MKQLEERIRTINVARAIEKAQLALNNPLKTRGEFKILQKVYDKIAKDVKRMMQGKDFGYSYHLDEVDARFAEAAVKKRRRETYIKDINRIHQK